MKQRQDGCSEVGMVLRSSQSWCNTGAGFVSCLSERHPNVHCTLITKFFQRGFLPCPLFYFLTKITVKGCKGMWIHLYCYLH